MRPMRLYLAGKGQGAQSMPTVQTVRLEWGEAAMTPEQKAAFIMGQAAMLNAILAGMLSENQMRLHRGEAPAYTEEAFQRVIAEYSILSWNGALEYLRD